MKFFTDILTLNEPCSKGCHDNGYMCEHMHFVGEPLPFVDTANIVCCLGLEGYHDLTGVQKIQILFDTVQSDAYGDSFNYTGDINIGKNTDLRFAGLVGLGNEYRKMGVLKKGEVFSYSKFLGMSASRLPFWWRLRVVKRF